MRRCTSSAAPSATCCSGRRTSTWTWWSTATPWRSRGASPQATGERLVVHDCVRHRDGRRRRPRDGARPSATRSPARCPTCGRPRWPTTWPSRLLDQRDRRLAGAGDVRRAHRPARRGRRCVRRHRPRAARRVVPRRPDAADPRGALRRAARLPARRADRRAGPRGGRGGPRHDRRRPAAARRAAAAAGRGHGAGRAGAAGGTRRAGRDRAGPRRRSGRVRRARRSWRPRRPTSTAAARASRCCCDRWRRRSASRFAEWLRLRRGRRPRRHRRRGGDGGGPRPTCRPRPRWWWAATPAAAGWPTDRHVTLELDGNDLAAELGLAPGPEIGRILDALLRAKRAGELPDRAAELERARALLA